MSAAIKKQAMTEHSAFQKTAKFWDRHALTTNRGWSLPGALLEQTPEAGQGGAEGPAWTQEPMREVCFADYFLKYMVIIRA